MIEDPEEQAAVAAEALCERFGVERLDLAFVLGSGWSAAADELGEPIGDCPLEELPGFSAPIVGGHGGMLRVVRTPNGKVAAVFTGRTHYYEGRGVDAVVHGVRTAAAAGATTLVLTNGCGGLNRDWAPGTPVLIADHLNLTGATPLHGATFIDLTEAYSRRLRALAHAVDARPARGRLRPVPRPRVRDPGRGADGRHPRRRPGGHVDRPGDHRGPRGRDWRCWASRWSPIWPPASPRHR